MGAGAALQKLEALVAGRRFDMVHSPIPKVSTAEGNALMKTWGRIKQADRDNLPEEDVPIEEISTWQKLVNKKGVARIIKGENVEHQGRPIYAMFSNGRYVLMDGNHRVTADLLMGKKTVRMRVKK